MTIPRGLCCVESDGPRLSAPASASGSKGSGEFGERGSDPAAGACFDPELVVTSPQVLHEGMAANDHARRAVAFEAAHGPQPVLESSVVGLDPMVGVLGGVVE